MPAPDRARPPRQRLVARAGRRPARPRDRAARSSATRPSTASSTPRSDAPMTAAGGTTCPAARASAAGAASAGGSARKLHRRPCFRSHRTSPGRRAIADVQAIGKPTSCSSPTTASPSSPSTSAPPVILLARPPSQKAATHRRALGDLLQAMPQPLRPDHHLRQRHRVRAALPAPRALGIETFFCDPHSPWQKGGVENAIGRIRRSCPAKPTSPPRQRPNQRSRSRLQPHPQKMPRLQNPSRGTLHQPLHFECESTS